MAQARKPRRYGGRRVGNLTNVGNLIQKALPAEERAELRAMRAFGWWERNLPERIRKNARPVQLNYGVLTIHAATAVWANELSYLTNDFLTRMKKELKSVAIRSIRVKVGPVPSAPPHVIQRPAKPVKVVLPSEMPDELARALAALPSDALRDVVTEAAGVSLGRDNQRRERRRRMGLPPPE